MTRADFNALAIQALNEGWTVVPHRDRTRNHYERGNVAVWLSSTGWRRAEMIDGIYRNHQTFPTFEEAIHG